MGIVQKVKQGMADTWAKVFGAPEKFFGREAAHRSLEDAFDIPGHLMEVVRQSYRDMDYVRKSHKSAVQQFVGRLREGDDTKVVPIPKLRQMVRVYTRLLSSGEPQARISTIHPEYRAFAKNLELHTNRQLVECNLEEAFRAAVLQSMFSVGCLKTGLASGMPDGDGVFEFEGVLYDAGKPFSKSVHINNLVLDMQAENGDALSFIGDRYYLPECVLMKIEEKDWEGAAEVMRQSQMAGEDRASGVIESADKRLYKSRLCWDIYLPMQNAVVMYADGSDHPLDVWSYDGPERGPYDLLGYDWVPGEVLPASPAQALLPLHEFVNVLVRKLERQAANQKTLALYQRGESDDADAIKKAADGEMVGVSHPDTVQERKFRGPDPGNHNMAIWGDQMFDVHAGNLGALGGTEAQTETFRGDAMLRESANALVEQMRKAVRTMMKRVIRKHAWFIWTDPIRSYETVKDLGAGIRIRTIMDPDVREGDFIDYNFDIDTYSTRDRTPMERAQSLKQEWAEVVLPNMPFFQAAGMMPNAVEMVKRVFELQGLEFAELFVPTDPNAMAQQQQGGQNGAVPWPGQFNMGMRQTVNTRVSRPGHTRAGNDKSLMDANSRLLASNDSK